MARNNTVSVPLQACPALNEPRSLKCPENCNALKAMLDQPHMAPLRAYAHALRHSACGIVEVPDFDPQDGGVQAKVLFLLEKPGPMTAAGRAGRAGSGFISRNNDDATAEATLDFMNRAGLPREQTVIWNVVPRWNGTRKITLAERREGLERLSDLIDLLSVRAVVMVGREAERARTVLETTDLELFDSPHPSPIVRRTNVRLWDTIPQRWGEVQSFLVGAEAPQPKSVQ